mgnify:CR=1 FL=1|jgi:hypothetical protein
MPQLQWIVYPELLELITRFNKYSCVTTGVTRWKELVSSIFGMIVSEKCII